MITFKKFLTESESKKKSIQYIEDLDLDSFINVFKNIDDFRITEKMDGVALRFGIENGNLFTTRSGKGSDKKIFDPIEWGESGASNIFRAAHKVLHENIDDIKTVLKDGDQIDIEVLYGDQPNAIVYGKDGCSYIILIKEVGTTGSDVIPTLNSVLTEKTTISDDVLISKNGIDLTTETEMMTWKFDVPGDMAPQLTAIDFTNELEDMEHYLSLKNDVVVDADLDLTNGEVWKASLTGIPKSVKDIVKSERESVQEIVLNDHMLKIKNKMFDEVIRDIQPNLQRDGAENIGIEGVVFYNTDTQLEFKIVDTEVFAAINRFNHKIRDTIKNTIKTNDPDASIEANGGLFGKARIRIANLFNIDGLSNPRNVKKILAPFKGASETETISNFAKSLDQSNPDALRTKIDAIYNTTIDDMKNALEVFQEDKNDYSLTLENGKIIKYSDAIIDRTILAFAEAIKHCNDNISDVRKCRTIEDIINMLFGKKINEMHGASLLTGEENGNRN